MMKRPAIFRSRERRLLTYNEQVEIQTFAEQEGLCVDVQYSITNWKSTLLYQVFYLLFRGCEIMKKG